MMFKCHPKDPGLKFTFQEKSLYMIERNGAVFLVLVISYKYFPIPLWGPMVTGFTHLQPTGAVGFLLPC